MQLCALGPLQISDGASLWAAGGPLQRRILARLALSPRRVVSFDALEFAAWTDNPPKSARHTVAAHVFRLRRLGIEISREADGYRLDSPTDLQHLEELLVAARSASQIDRDHSRDLLREALALFRGAPFVEIDHVDEARIESARIGDLIASLREDLVEIEIDGRAPNEAIAAALQLATTEPYRERRWELLMLALYRAGRQADALDAFATCRRRLIDDLGVEPGPSLRRMQQSVLAQDPRLDRVDSADSDDDGPGAQAGSGAGPHVVVRHRVPATSTRLIGRRLELDELAAVWDRTRVVTLLGPPGAGKTRLMLEAVAVETDNVWFVAMDQDSEGRSVAAAVLDVVAPASRATDALDGVVAALGSQRGLLVLDGCDERSVEAAECAAAMLLGCGGVRLLATSRERLGMLDEAIITIGPMHERDARDLLIDRARLVQPAFAISAADEAIASRLCALVDHLPLGIELIARHLQLLRLGEAVARVDADLARWAGGAVGTSRGLWSALDTTTARLSQRERSVLTALAVMSADADLALITAVAAADESDADSAEDDFATVARLVDMSLVQVRVDDGPTRYRLLRSVAVHALQQVSDDERVTRIARYHQAALTTARNSVAHLGGADRAVTIIRLDRVIAHVRAVLAALIVDPGDGERAVDALRLTVDLNDYWLGRHPAEGIDWLTALLAVTNPDNHLRAEALLSCGHLAYWCTDFDRGTKLLEQARSLFDIVGDALGEGRTLRRLGAIATARDDLETGRRQLTAALACFEEAAAEIEVGTTLLHLGSLLADQGIVGEAHEVLGRALSIAKAGRDPLSVGHALAALTLVHWKAGDLDAARETGEEAITLFVELGHRPTEGTVAYRLASVSRSLGHMHAARRYALRAIDAGVQTGTRTTIAFGHLNLARLDLDAGDLVDASDHLTAALGAIDPDADRWVLVELLEAVARLCSVLDLIGVPGLIESAATIRAEIHQPISPRDLPDIEHAAKRSAAFERSEREPAPTADGLAAHTIASSLCRQARSLAMRRSPVRHLRTSPNA